VRAVLAHFCGPIFVWTKIVRIESVANCPNLVSVVGSGRDFRSLVPVAISGGWFRTFGSDRDFRSLVPVAISGGWFRSLVPVAIFRWLVPDAISGG
jgi:hypothetical protein